MKIDIFKVVQVLKLKWIF